VSRNLLLTGGPVHDFDATSGALAGLLGEVGFETVVTDDPAELFGALGHAPGSPPALVTVNALRWRMEQPRYAHLRDAHAYSLADDDAALLDAFVRRGGGLLVLHAGVISFDAHPTWQHLCGATWDWDSSAHPPCGPVTVHVTPHGQRHPLTAGIDDFVVEDEVYGFLDEVGDLAPLLTSDHGGRSHPVLWARPVGAGRVVTDLLGHGTASLAHPAHREVLRRAAAWVTGAAG
jgi:hypothetical protein